MVKGARIDLHLVCSAGEMIASTVREISTATGSRRHEVDATLGYIVIRCSVLEESAEFYRSLGLDVVRERHGQGPEHYAISLGGIVLELYPSLREPITAVRLGMVIDDISGVVARLTAAGVDVSQRGREWTVRDPDGHVIALSARA